MLILHSRLLQKAWAAMIVFRTLSCCPYIAFVLELTNLPDEDLLSGREKEREKEREREIERERAE